MNRRRLLAALPLALAAPLAMRELRGGATGTSASPSYRIALPGLSAEGYHPRVTLSSTQVSQGGVISVTIDNALSGTVEAFGRTYLLGSDEQGALRGLVGVGPLDRTGPADVIVRYIDKGQQTGSQRWLLTVLRTAWTVDYIYLPPPPPADPNAPPPPPPPPSEETLLPVLYAGRTPPQWQPQWLLPVPQPAVVSGCFGEQRSFNGGPVAGHHGGADFAAPEGTPVRAANAGTVVLAGLYRVRGNIVMVDHGGGIFTLYGHLRSIAVREGMTVTPGQLLGEVGSTGLSTGPHLHWEVGVSGALVDGLSLPGLRLDGPLTAIAAPGGVCPVDMAT